MRDAKEKRKENMKKLIVKNPWKASVGSDELEWVNRGVAMVMVVEMKKSPYAHTYIYDGNTHDSQQSMLLLLLSKALLACKTCIYGEWKWKREEMCVIVHWNESEIEKNSPATHSEYV